MAGMFPVTGSGAQTVIISRKRQLFMNVNVHSSVLHKILAVPRIITLLGSRTTSPEDEDDGFLSLPPLHNNGLGVL